jgi:lipoprotein-releasing system permease protein
MSSTLVRTIALRYLRSRRGMNAVPVLSAISMLAIAVASAAMIVLFSVFNGFEGLVRDLYKAFYPDLRISAAKGKMFQPDSNSLRLIYRLKGVQETAFVLEDNVLVNSNDEQMVVTLKGVTPAYFRVNNIKPYIIAGQDSLATAPVPAALIGMHIATQLGIDVKNVFSEMALFYPHASGMKTTMLDPQSALQSAHVRPQGIFRVQDEFDARYVLVPIEVARYLFHASGQVSAWELKLDEKADAASLKKAIAGILGKGFRVETRYEQNRLLYLVMRTEKWAVYAILTLVLLIASFNMVGALSLLAMEKEKDMAILRAMGAGKATIGRIFVAEGMSWSLIGCLAGLATGTLLCLGQHYFQWIKLDGSFIIDAYPVAMQPLDFLLVLTTVMAVGMLLSLYPAWRIMHMETPSLRS